MILFWKSRGGYYGLITDPASICSNTLGELVEMSGMAAPFQEQFSLVTPLFDRKAVE